MHDHSEVWMNGTRSRERTHCHVGVVPELPSLLSILPFRSCYSCCEVAVEDVVERREHRLGIDHDDRLSELHRRLDLEHQVASSGIGLVLGKVAETNDASLRLVEEIEREQQRHAALGISWIEHHHVSEGSSVWILAIPQPISQALAQWSEVRHDRQVSWKLKVRSVRLLINRGKEQLHQLLERFGSDAVEVALQGPQQHVTSELKVSIID